MKTFLILFSFILSFSAFSQHEFMVWTEIGAKGKIIKKLSWAADINSRFGRNGVETFFPQVGVEYKVKKWLIPSIEYRYIVDKNKFGNYKATNRLNFNIEFAKSVKKLEMSLRTRYQYAFNRISGEAYDADFDQAFRFKPAFEYDLKNTIFTPAISAEFFFDPSYGPTGPGFTKMRLAAGVKLDLKSPHGISFKYQLDKKFNDYAADLRHVIALAYKYKF